MVLLVGVVFILNGIIIMIIKIGLAKAGLNSGVSYFRVVLKAEFNCIVVLIRRALWGACNEYLQNMCSCRNMKNIFLYLS